MIRTWNPLLHPRGRDGRFIEVGGWVRGLFGRGQVLRVEPNHDDPDDPLVITDAGSAPASTLVRAAESKARIEWLPGHYLAEPARFEQGHFFDEPRGRSVPRVEGHIRQGKDGSFSYDMDSHGEVGGNSPWLDVYEGGFPSEEMAKEAVSERLDLFHAAEQGSQLAELEMNLTPSIRQNIEDAVSGVGVPIKIMMGSTNSPIMFSEGLIEWNGRVWHSLDLFLASLS